MKSEWKRYKISEFAQVVGGGTPSTKIDEYYGGDIAWLTPKDMSMHKGKYISYGSRNITELGLSKSSAKTVPKGTVLFTSRAPIGYIAIAEQEVSTNQGFKSLICDANIAHNEFIYYLLKNQVPAIKSIASGSTFKEVSGGVLKDFLVTLPPLPIQKKIAHILGALDDKIELNRKMNETLEAMAQAIFKSWFVDFDPVHAKAKCKNDTELEEAAKKLGISKEILDLFPSEFEESELGMIPKGWKTNPLDQIAHYQNGLALQKFRPKDEKKFLPVLKIAQLKKGFADGEEKADVDIKPECIVYDGDVIFSWSGSLVVDIWCGGKVALNQHLFKVTSTDYSKWFYYLWTKQHLENFQRVAAAKAVTMGHIKRSHLTEALCVIPDELVFEMAEQQINPLIEKLIINKLENNSLQKARDTLLPKLLSGELDVSNIDMEVE